MAIDGDTQSQSSEPETTASAAPVGPLPDAAAAASSPSPAPEPVAPAASASAGQAAQTGPGGPAPSSEPTPDRPSLWPARLSAASSATYDWVMQPRVRLAIAGVIVALIGAGPASGSVWTLPLVIVGVIMILIACIGHRLRGRFVIEWGEAGAEIGFSASVAPAPDRARRSIIAPAGRAPASIPVEAAAAPAGDNDVIEGEAHTVEIDVAELKALIAAAENAENGNGPAARGGAWREVNVHRLSATARSADAPARENRG